MGYLDIGKTQEEWTVLLLYYFFQSPKNKIRGGSGGLTVINNIKILT